MIELSAKIKTLADRVAALSNEVRTEEAAKTAFVLPFIQALGYDVFNPLEVVPEHIADYGLKKGEKVDYAIKIDGVPLLLIECKQVGAPLEFKHAGQLFRYFTATAAKFGVLTDGVRYLFYTDLDAVNIMDERPFFEFNLQAFDDSSLAELMTFSKGVFQVDSIQKSAVARKSLNLLQATVQAEFSQPSDEFLRVLFAQVNPGSRFTAQAKDTFTPLVKHCLDTVLADAVNKRLNAAMLKPEPMRFEPDEEGVVTTAEELAAFNIIQAICSEVVDAADVVIRDAKSYCAVLFQDNNRKPLARLYFNRAKQLQVGLFSESGEEKFSIEKVADIYGFKLLIKSRLAYYLTPAKPGSAQPEPEPRPAGISPSSVPAALVVNRFQPTVFGGARP